MVALETPICDFGWKAPEFNLIGIDNSYYSFQDIKGTNGTLVMFICNHCPYVKSVIHRIVEDITILKEKGIGLHLVSDISALYEGIPRVKLEDTQ